MVKRRKTIKLASSIIGSITAASGVGAARGQNNSAHKLPSSYEEQLIDRYGQKEGKKTSKIVGRYYKQAKNGVLNNKEFYDRVTDAILNHPRIPTVKADIIEHWKEMPVAHRREEATWAVFENIDSINENDGELDDNGWIIPENNETINRETKDIRKMNVGETDSISIASSNVRNERFTYSESDTNSSGASSSSATADDRFYYYNGDYYYNESFLRSKSESYLYGSAWGYARGYGSLSGFDTGDYEISTRYHLNGNADTGSTTLSLFARRHSDGATNIKQIDSPVTVNSEWRSKYKNFNLNSGETYDIGVELRSRTSASGSANRSDYYDDVLTEGQRGVYVKYDDDINSSLRFRYVG